MTKPSTPDSAKAAASRDPRPFSHLAPRLVTVKPPAIDVGGRAVLEARTGEYVPALVRALVQHTIELQHRRALLTGRRQPIAMSVLNRRRRCARAWIQAVLAGAVDRATLHAVASQWLPTLAGNLPQTRGALPTARSCVEFLRGALTGLIFDTPAENLLGHARAQHVLETVLAAHLAAFEESIRSDA